MALLTASDLTAAVAAPTGDADLVARLAVAADAAVRRFLGRDFTAGPFTELHPGGGRLLFLARYPVAAVTSLAVDAARTFPAESVRPATSYLVHADRGVIENLDGPFGPDRPDVVRVVYTADATVPDTVKQATLLLAEHWYRESKTHAATGQLNLGTAADGTSYPWGQSSGYRLPPAVLQLLKLERGSGGVGHAIACLLLDGTVRILLFSRSKRHAIACPTPTLRPARRSACSPPAGGRPAAGRLGWACANRNGRPPRRRGV